MRDPRDEPLWTTRDVAAYLACSAATVSRLIGRRGLPFVPTIGRGRRFCPAAVRAWVARNEAAIVPPDVPGPNATRTRPPAPPAAWDGTPRAGDWRRA